MKKHNWRWWAVLIVVVTVGIGFTIWVVTRVRSNPVSVSPSASTPRLTYAALDSSETQAIVYAGHGFTFHLPADWRLERYLGREGVTEQSDDTIIDRTTEVSSYGGYIPQFIQLRHRTRGVEMDLKLIPGFDGNNLPPLSYKEYTFRDEQYHARYIADCEGEKLMYIEQGQRSLLIQVQEFCDAPEQEQPDMDETFRAVISGFSFAQ